MTSKTQNVVGGCKKCGGFRMCLELNDYQLKTSRYSYRSICINSMVATNQKATLDTQKLKRKEHKSNTEEKSSNHK